MVKIVETMVVAEGVGDRIKGGRVLFNMVMMSNEGWCQKMSVGWAVWSFCVEIFLFAAKKKD